MGIVLLVLGLLGVLHALNAFHPTKWPPLFIPSFFSSWLTLELIHHHVVIGATIVAVGVAQGGLDTLTGTVGLALVSISVIAFAVMAVASSRTRVVVGDALVDLDPDEAPSFPRTHVVFPFLMTRRRGVRRRRNLEFARVAGRTLRLDVYEPADRAPGERRPAVVQIHGGGWMIGDKREQGIPLLNHLAANGWVGFNVNYRLSPGATWPDHLVDCKRAIAWIREHADEFGIDPDFLAVTGGSAGGHLTAMVALTAADRSLQPGFEDADTSVQAAVPFYGVYDFTDRLGVWDDEFLHRFLEPHIMKRFLADEPEAYAAASPLDRVHAGAPPMLVVHGSRDTLAPVEYARDFVERLQQVSSEPVVYVEMRGAQHAFDVFPSVRTARTIEGVERFLHVIHRRWLEGRTAGDPELEAALTD